MLNKIHVIKGVRFQVDKNGSILVNAEDFAEHCGLVFESFNGKKKLSWWSVARYLEETGYKHDANLVGSDTFIDVKYIDRLRWKYDFEKFRLFNYFIENQAIPQLKVIEKT